MVKNLRRHFLPWDRPLLPQAAAWLAAGWAGGGPLDLARTLVVVPTRQAGRRLREALAEHAAARGQAVFPPRVVTPETLLALDLAPGAAPRLDSLLAWTEILRAVPLEDFRDVFPVDPPARNFAWALRLAGELARLQSALAEAGLLLGEVAGRAGENFPEAGRWQQLGELEKLHAATLAAHGLRDLQGAKISAARHPSAPTEFARLVLLAAPDPLPLALTVLAAHARTLPVEVLVFAPPDEAENFDDWGRPLAAHWERRVLALPEFTHRVHLCADPAAQAEKLAAAARAHAEPDGLLALGVADPEVLPLLARELAHAGLAAFNPEGRPRSGEQLFHLLTALAALGREPSSEAVAALARCPDFLAFLRARLGENFSAARFLAGLDDQRSAHLPADLAAARTHASGPLAAALALMEELRATLTAGEFPANAAAALATIFATRRLDLGHEADARFEDAAGAWTDVLRECATAQARFGGLAGAEAWELALRLFGDTARTEDKPAGALELQGWLELLFEDAPQLAVAGFNDGRVPDAVVGDAFLPESLRAALGLKTNAARFARDAYLLQAIAASRPRLDLVLGKTSVAGDPLRPSRLLLRCAEAELPERVRFLFRAAEASGTAVPWSRAWKLAPRRAAPPTRVAVTGLRGWLACPFRFYLKNVLRMSAVDPAKDELDALDFGTLCHAALEAMGHDAVMRDCTEVAALREFLLSELEKNARARFGAEHTLPLVIQLESARQRLAKAAEVQAQERAAGWVVVDVEKKFELTIGGIVVSGKIDRIDRHAETGAVRVLDYKTSDSPVAPAAAHVRARRKDETPPEWALVTVDGRERVWADLQLPLYLHAVAAELGRDVMCGYFNLPKAAGGTGIAAWENFSPELRESAWRCAEGVCAAIRAGEFWPPNENVKADYDDFAELFQQGAGASVAWENLKP